MAGLFSFLFFWQNRIEQSGYFAKIYRQAVENIEISRNIVPLRRDWLSGRYVDELLQISTDRAKEWQKKEGDRPSAEKALTLAGELDAGFNDMVFKRRVHDIQFSVERSLYQLMAVGNAGSPDAIDFTTGGSSTGNLSFSGTGIGTPPPGMSYYRASSYVPPAGPPGHEADKPSPELVDKLKSFDNTIDDLETSTRKWVSDAYTCMRGWYHDDLKTVRQEASDSADLVLSVDFSALRGRGPEFVLEFTAIIVIIFAAVILGIGNVLGNEQIGTLLAAIAGYVLGKAASRGTSAPPGPPAGTGTSSPETPANPAARTSPGHSNPS